MALRRPILLYCIITIVLGVSFDWDRSPPHRLVRPAEPPACQPKTEPVDLTEPGGMMRCGRGLVDVSEGNATLAKDSVLTRVLRLVMGTCDVPSAERRLLALSACCGSWATDWLDDERHEAVLFCPQMCRSILSLAVETGPVHIYPQLIDNRKNRSRCVPWTHGTTVTPCDIRAPFNETNCKAGSSVQKHSNKCTEDEVPKPRDSQSYVEALKQLWNDKETEHNLSVISICLSYLIGRYGDLKEKLLSALSPLNQSSKNSMLTTLLTAVLGSSSQTQSDAQDPSTGNRLSPHDRDHHVPKSERNVKPIPATSKLWDLGPDSLRKFSEHPANDKENAYGLFYSKDWSRSTFSSSFFQNLRRTVYHVSPVAFLPSVGSSPTGMMSHLGSRLASMFSLPSTCNIPKTVLAQAGFFYDTTKKDRNAGNAHEVTCYSCGLTYSQWKAGDNPTAIHLSLKPDCAHAKAEAGSAGNSTLPGVARPPMAGASPSSLQSTDSGISSMGSSSSGSSGRASMASSVSSLTSGRGSLALSESGSLYSFVSEADSGLGGRSYTSTSGARGTATGRSSNHIYSDSTAAGRTDGLGDLQTDACGISSERLPPATAPAVSAATRTARPPVNSYDHQRHAPATPARAEPVDEHPRLDLGSAVYPQFTKQDDRLKTFSKWPSGHFFRPEDLVMQGLYYAGYADCVRCFYCGVGLKSWAREDDVMAEHIRHRPSCGYLLHLKGSLFVNGVLRRSQQQTPVQPPAPAPQAPPTRPATATSTAVPTAANSSSSGAGNAGGVSGATLTEVESMGFPKDVIAKAHNLLKQHSPGSNITAEALVDKVLELNSSTSQASSNNQAPRGGGLDRAGLAVDGVAEEESEYMQVYRENAMLKARNTCVICHESKVGIIFLPCGHVNTCTSCGNKTKHCTTCGQNIKATANVFLS